MSCVLATDKRCAVGAVLVRRECTRVAVWGVVEVWFHCFSKAGIALRGAVMFSKAGMAFEVFGRCGFIVYFMKQRLLFMCCEGSCRCCFFNAGITFEVFLICRFIFS